MRLNLSADEVLTSTRAVRKRLDFDRPVEREVIEECLQIALQAPTGGNSQGWQWLMITDDDKKRALADIYRANFSEYAKIAQSNSYQEGDLRYEQRDKVSASAVYLVENFHRAPVLMIPCIAGKLDRPRRSRRRRGGDRCCPPCGASCSRLASAGSAQRGRPSI